jgi:hypothetical protein
MVRSAGRRCVVLLVTLALAVVLAPSPAAASTLFFERDGRQRAEIGYSSEEAVVNVIRVRRAGRTYFFRDSEPITADSPCRLTGRRARCAVPRVRHVVRIFAGELRDRVSVFGSVPTEVDGGPGNDSVSGGAAADVVFGGDGADVLRGSGGNDALEGLRHNDRLSGGRGHDALYGDEGRDRLRGGPGRDSLEGGAQDDVLNGGRGDDELAGDDGSNRIFGGRGHDRIWTTTGGRDVVHCGPGFDHAFISHNDRIVGCERVFRPTGRRRRRL